MARQPITSIDTEAKQQHRNRVYWLTQSGNESTQALYRTPAKQII